ncbi:MAG: 30S ribosomal protein S13 [Sedimentisphaeraceae bacterium JB056]
MPRIVGVDVPNNKRLVIALTYIHGIGNHMAAEIIKKAGADENIKASELSEDDVSKLAQIITNEYVVEGQLRRKVAQDIARLKDITCYRGLRHRRSLPCRGQQTQSNARTRKGRKKTVAGKKSVKGMR